MNSRPKPGRMRPSRSTMRPAAASLRIFFAKTEIAGCPPAGGRLYLTALPIGAVVGFVSGLVGIGGGIFLCPILVLLRWMKIKEASAAASFFILVNSLSGLAGQLQKGFFVHEPFLPLALAVFAGGYLGSKIGSSRLQAFHFQRILASLIGVIALQILSKLL